MSQHNVIKASKTRTALRCTGTNDVNYHLVDLTQDRALVVLNVRTRLQISPFECYLLTTDRLTINCLFRGVNPCANDACVTHMMVLRMGCRKSLRSC